MSLLRVRVKITLKIAERRAIPSVKQNNTNNNKSATQTIFVCHFSFSSHFHLFCSILIFMKSNYYFYMSSNYSWNVIRAERMREIKNKYLSCYSDSSNDIPSPSPYTQLHTLLIHPLPLGGYFVWGSKGIRMNQNERQIHPEFLRITSIIIQFKWIELFFSLLLASFPFIIHFYRKYKFFMGF